jgi:hypothetical protein
MAGIDRRRFLFAAVATGAGLTGGASAWAAPVRKPDRAATYRGLVRALRSAPDGRFRHADPRVAQRRYARWYATQPEAIQAHADAVLDALGSPTYEQLATARRDRAADERPDVPTLAPA